MPIPLSRLQKSAPYDVAARRTTLGAIPMRRGAVRCRKHKIGSNFAKHNGGSDQSRNWRWLSVLIRLSALSVLKNQVEP